MTIIFMGGGKWERRIVQTLQEAGTPLALKSLTIRAGKFYDSYASCSLRASVVSLTRRGILVRVRRGIYDLAAR